MIPPPLSKKSSPCGLRAVLVLALVSVLEARGEAAPPTVVPPIDCAAPLHGQDLNQLVRFLWNDCYNKLNWPRDREVRTTDRNPDGTGVHGWVRISYDPRVVAWLHDRKLPLADGTLIIKESYSVDAHTGTKALAGWVLMFKDPRLSYDGWWWGSVELPTDCTLQPGQDVAQCASGQSFSPNCLGCHAAANNRELTFSALGNIGVAHPAALGISTLPSPRLTPPAGQSPPILHLLMQRRRKQVAEQAAPRATIGLAQAALMPLPSQLLDHVAVPAGGPKAPGFVTSDICSGCHDASNLRYCSQYPAPPTCRVPVPAMALADASSGLLLNLSPWAEWSTSLMGLAGRDPVFQAQLESERTLFPGQRDTIDDTCYHCHGVMGQRSAAAAGKLFTHSMFLAKSGPAAALGALGRDGVSCTVCHRITPGQLGTPASFTGNFQLGPPGQLFGPFRQPRSFVMKNSLGIEPVAGEALTESAMCGSCHVVNTPILDAGSAPGKPRLSHEQTTYLEWRNSSYTTERPAGSSPQSCQACHMPRQFDRALGFPIANIEDNTFFRFDNTAPVADITLPVRAPYGRHGLVGANPFVLALFRADAKLKPPLLGVVGTDFNYIDPSQWVERLDLAYREELRFAQSQSAALTLALQPTPQGTTDLAVTVTNLAGHKLPTGVGFRRAFVYVAALDARGQVLWSSGASNERGMLTDAKGQILPFEQSDTRFEPYHRLIDSDAQVQIYEERYLDHGGKLSTSFLSIDRVVKDDRLLPAGWRSAGPEAALTQPVGEVGDSYRDGSGSDRVIYRLPPAVMQRAARLTAALYYQTIPPYYLSDRLRIGKGQPATAVLGELLKQVGDFAGTPLAGWKLALASATLVLR